MKKGLLLFLIILFISGCGTTATVKAPDTQGAADNAKTVQSSSTQPTTAQPKAVAQATLSSTSVGDPVKTINDTLDGLLGQRKMNIDITQDLGPNFEPGSIGLNVNFKYAEKDNAKIQAEILKIVRELAKTGQPIKVLAIFVHSPNNEKMVVGNIHIQRVDVKSLADATDDNILTLDKKHWVDITKE